MICFGSICLSCFTFFFFQIFKCRPFLKSSLNLLQYWFYAVVFCPWGIWDPTFPTKDRPLPPCTRRQILNQWTTREVACFTFWLKYTTHMERCTHQMNGSIIFLQVNTTTVTDFIFFNSKITADDDCSHESKRCLLLERKAMTNPESILKSRDVTLATKVCIVESMVFPIVMYRCESWTIKKAEHQRTDAFELWCWRRLFRVLWTARRSNQSILKEINPEYSLEGLMLKLKFQYFGHLMQSTDSLKRPQCW